MTSARIGRAMRPITERVSVTSEGDVLVLEHHRTFDDGHVWTTRS